MKPKIAITMGDPAGVGPELCLRLLANETVQQNCTPIILGDLSVLKSVSQALGDCLAIPRDCSVLTLQQFQTANLAGATIVDLQLMPVEHLTPGQVNRHTGAASFGYIEAAIAAAIDGTVDAVATGPINKEAWQSAGINFPGHTELFAARSNTDQYCMMMTSPTFSCSLVTTHCGYHEVPQLLTTELIFQATQLTHAALKSILGREPNLLMMGLNPHAGEGGLFGNLEEEKIIQPAVDQAIGAGMNMIGPLPADTAFLPWRREQTDGYICMYHDQGLIPFKAFNFDTGVNITLGLPIIRTSVDHGTALDIAWQGKAEVSSFVSAVALAAKLVT